MVWSNSRYLDENIILGNEVRNTFNYLMCWLGRSDREVPGRGQPSYRNLGGFSADKRPVDYLLRLQGLN